MSLSSNPSSHRRVFFGCKVQSSTQGTKLTPLELISEARNAYQLAPQLLGEKAGLIEIEGKDKNEMVLTLVPCPTRTRDLFGTAHSLKRLSHSQTL
jgi:hypothetical protein